MDCQLSLRIKKKWIVWKKTNDSNSRNTHKTHMFCDYTAIKELDSFVVCIVHFTHIWWITYAKQYGCYVVIGIWFLHIHFTNDFKQRSCR